MISPELDLEATLAEVRSRQLILLEHGALWAPHTYVPMATRRAIRAHRRDLVALIALGDIRVCPSRDRHRASWYHAGQGRYLCGLCRQLAARAG